MESDVKPARAAWRQVVLGGRTLAIPDEPLCIADSGDVANQLLAEYAALPTGQQVLVLGAGSGVLAAWIAQQARPSRLLIGDIHRAALDRAAATLQHNRAGVFELLLSVQLADLEPGSLDSVLVNSAFQSSSRALADLLAVAARALRPGGRMYVAGAKAQGIAAIKTRLSALLGGAATLGYRKGVHILAATRPAQLPELAPAAQAATEISVRGHTLTLLLRDGVFARGGLDAGTRMLLEVIDVPADARLLDLGCGSGIIGMILARLAPQGAVDLVDSDGAAVDLARANLSANQIANAHVYVSDGLSALPGASFDLIASNPPFHIGRRQMPELAVQLLSVAGAALRPGGRMYVVANRFLPYERVLIDAVGNVSEIAGDRHYKVLLSNR